MTRRGRLTRSEVAGLPTGSPAEILLAVQLEQAGIPFEREYRFAKLAMKREWRADFVVFGKVWKENLGGGVVATHRANGVLVEIDGGAFVAGRHVRGTGVEADAEKQSAAAILGYRVIRATPRQVEDGRALAWIEAALGRKAAA
jgi:hypothetical protein